MDVDTRRATGNPTGRRTKGEHVTGTVSPVTVSPAPKAYLTPFLTRRGIVVLANVLGALLLDALPTAVGGNKARKARSF